MLRVLSPKELQHLIQNDHWEGKVHHQHLSCILKPSAVYLVIHPILQHLRILRLLCLSYPFFKAPSHASQAGKRQRLWPGMACRESPECQRQNNGTQMSRQCPAKVAKSIANTSENNDIQDHQNKLRSKVDDDRTFRQEHHWILSIIGHDGHAK